MLIDIILDRKDGVPYNPQEFLRDVKGYEETFDFGNGLSSALEAGDEEVAKEALVRYLKDYGYDRPEIIRWVLSQNWTGGVRESFRRSGRILKEGVSEKPEVVYTFDFYTIENRETGELSEKSRKKMFFDSFEDVKEYLEEVVDEYDTSWPKITNASYDDENFKEDRTGELTLTFETPAYRFVFFVYCSISSVPSYDLMKDILSGDGINLKNDY